MNVEFLADRVMLDNLEIQALLDLQARLVSRVSSERLVPPGHQVYRVKGAQLGVLEMLDARETKEFAGKTEIQEHLGL